MAALNVQVIVGLFLINFAKLGEIMVKLVGIICMSQLHEKRALALALGVTARQRSKIKTKRQQKRLRKLKNKPRSTWFQPGRTDSWWTNIRLGISPEDHWKKFFRMDKGLFYKVLSEVESHLKLCMTTTNYRALSAEKKLAMALYYLKDTGSLSMTVNSFGVAINTASVVIYQVCHVICRILGQKYIHLPKDKSEMMEKVGEFEAKFGMPQAFGCIDGTHVKIKRPTENSQDYFCYKQYFSLNVQAVCDARGYFLDVECMWPGSVHDAKVFANSKIHRKLRNAELPSLWQTLARGTAKVPNYLIDDPAYPLMTYCIKEYESCGSDEEVIFNNILRAARNQIECAFGRLKARWAFLTKMVDLRLEAVPTVIYACFILHNICEQNQIAVDEHILKEQIDLIKQNEEQFQNNPDPIYSFNEGEGEIVRRTIVKMIKEYLH